MSQEKEGEGMIDFIRDLLAGLREALSTMLILTFGLFAVAFLIRLRRKRT